MSKQKIVIDHPSAESYVLLALSSLESDYRLAWLLNNHLSTTLQRNEFVLGKENLQFSVFTTEESPTELKYTLLSNKNKQEGAVLLREYSTVDFFLKVSGEITANTLTGLHSRVKSIAEVSACIPLTLKKQTTLFFNNL